MYLSRVAEVEGADLHSSYTTVDPDVVDDVHVPQGVEAVVVPPIHFEVDVIPGPCRRARLHPDGRERSQFPWSAHVRRLSVTCGIGLWSASTARPHLRPV